MTNQDKKLINACTSDDALELFSDFHCEHPMDKQIIDKLKQLGKLIRKEDDDYQIFRHREEIDSLWGMLLEKAIKCLRFYDGREPFQESNEEKIPKAYGLDELKKYYKKYTEFEKVLYGANKYYRDHVVHVLRTWLSGIELLTKNSGKYLERLSIHEKAFSLELNSVEKISMWTIISLTHDLGYPLQKAKSIIDVTQDMVSTFVTNPDISADFSFHGVQNYMNDFILRLMSSKMENRNNKKPIREESVSENKKVFVARLQSKYYFKFQKSLEHNSHGILSTLIIYKLLTYFLESDYNINEDYTFDEEECRQFYIRREILRAIASHTCDDIYQMYMGSFSFLLRICDDTQEWGRKNISQLYVNSGQEHNLQDIILSFTDDPTQGTNKCTIKETMNIPEDEKINNILLRFREQAMVYIMIFRDGQDTASRDFSFEKNLSITTDDISLSVTLNIDKDRASTLKGEVKYSSTQSKNKRFGKSFFDNLYPGCESQILDASGKEADKNKADEWDKGNFTIPLLNR